MSAAAAALGRSTCRPAHIHFEAHHPDLVTYHRGEVCFTGDPVIALDIMGADVSKRTFFPHCPAKEDVLPADGSTWIDLAVRAVEGRYVESLDTSDSTGHAAPQVPHGAKATRVRR